MKKLLFLCIPVLILGCNPRKSAGPKKQALPPSEQADSLAVKPAQQSRATDYTNMVYFAGGEIQVGANTDDPMEGPAFQAYVEPFYLDKHPVTVAMFRKFVEATGFRTEAENFGNAGVFLADQGQWQLVDGADWKYPLGPSGPPAGDDHPVTQVSWNDALAYCRWAGKRLPTEIEWEYAARSGEAGDVRFPWGNEIRPGGRYMANYWQGDLSTPQGDDGFVYTSPVGFYGELPSGLTDMAGNVWEWCSSIFEPYPGSSVSYRPDPANRCIRGGSFFYDQAGDESLAVYFRSSNTVETSLFNTGFRCAADPPGNKQ